MDLKTISATLAILGTGLTLSACRKAPAEGTEVPGDKAPGAEGSCGADKGHGHANCSGEKADKPADGSCSGEKAPGSGEKAEPPADAATPAATAVATPGTGETAPAEATAKPTETTTKATPKKKKTAKAKGEAACGEGTCGG